MSSILAAGDSELNIEEGVALEVAARHNAQVNVTGGFTASLAFDGSSRGTINTGVRSHIINEVNLRNNIDIGSGEPIPNTNRSEVDFFGGFFGMVTATGGGKLNFERHDVDDPTAAPNSVFSLRLKERAEVDAKEGDFDETIFKGFSTGFFSATTHDPGGEFIQSSLRLLDVMLMNDDDPENPGETIPNTNNSHVVFSGAKINTLTVSGNGLVEFVPRDPSVVADTVPTSVVFMHINENGRVVVHEAVLSDVYLTGASTLEILNATRKPNDLFVFARDDSSITVADGDFSGGNFMSFGAGDNATVDINGGDFSNGEFCFFDATGNATLNITDGKFSNEAEDLLGILALDDSEVNISGGEFVVPFDAPFATLDFGVEGTLNIFGGLFEGKITTSGGGTINIFGADFEVTPMDPEPFQSAAASAEGTSGVSTITVEEQMFNLTGFLADGTPINIDVEVLQFGATPEINLVTVPEPSTLVVMAAMLGFPRRRRRFAA
ncbi:hypothetical protein OAS39_06130 [Pirellulales bacterium]|nr:hypothetical protein [Pirellulales bacterium]